MMTKMRLALDAQTARRYDTNGFLHIEGCHIAKEKVYPYFGYELPPEYGLEPEETYYAYLPANVLAASARSFCGLPLLLDHHDDCAAAPSEYRVGSLGDDAKYSPPYLDVSLHVTDARAIEQINSGERRELSIGFYADYRLYKGQFDGTPYGFLIERLTGNHVALVDEGRAGHDCVVADSVGPFMRWARENRLLPWLAEDRKGPKSAKELAGQREYNRSRPKRDSFYWTYAWEVFRREYLKKHPVCESCHKARSVLVDHIKPVSKGGAMLAASNVQALCAACHNRKTAAQKG